MGAGLESWEIGTALNGAGCDVGGDVRVNMHMRDTRVMYGHMSEGAGVVRGKIRVANSVCCDATMRRREATNGS